MLTVLVRHPRPRVASGVCYGRLDLHVHRLARPQIRAAVGRLAGFSPGAIFSSPARRCGGMAAAIGSACSVAPAFDARLLELDFGAWEGLAWNDVPREALDEWAADPYAFAPPCGESGAALVARVTTFHDDLVRMARNTVVVAHGGPLKVLHALLEGRSVDLLAPSPPLGEVIFVRSAGEG